MTKDEFVEEVRKLMIQLDNQVHYELLLQITEFDKEEDNKVIGNDILCTDCAVCMSDILQRHIEVNNLQHASAHSNSEKVH